MSSEYSKEYRIGQIRKQKAVEAQKFQSISKDLFREKHKAERMAKALTRTGKSLRGKIVLRNKMQELMQKAEEDGMILTKSGQKMKRSLAGNARVLDDIIRHEVEGKVGEVKDEEQSPEEQRKEERHDETIKRMNQRERAEEIAVEAQGEKQGRSLAGSAPVMENDSEIDDMVID